MKARNALFTALALGLSLAAPAFAQDAMQDQSTTPTAQPQAATPADAAAPAQPADPAASAQTTPATPADPATPASPASTAPGQETRQVTWSDLDTDQDGKLTKTEVAPVQALSQVFDDADADKDGALTPDEYKAFVAKNQAEAAAPPQG